MLTLKMKTVLFIYAKEGGWWRRGWGDEMVGRLRRHHFVKFGNH
jgi:hypothetical protein